MRQCQVCKLTLSTENFGIRSHEPDGMAKLCKQCANERQLLYRSRRSAESNQRYRKKAAERRRQHVWGFSNETYEFLHAIKQNTCEICGLKSEALDHDHRTGEIRGVLCKKCNRGLGHFLDDPSLILKAWDYLKFHLDQSHLRLSDMQSG